MPIGTRSKNRLLAKLLPIDDFRPHFAEALNQSSSLVVESPELESHPADCSELKPWGRADPSSRPCTQAKPQEGAPILPNCPRRDLAVLKIGRFASLENRPAEAGASLVLLRPDAPQRQDWRRAFAPSWCIWSHEHWVGLG